MKSTRLWALAALPFALAACGGADEEVAVGDADAVAVVPAEGTAPAAAPMPAPTDMSATPMAGTVAMNPVGSSGVSGQAQFMEHGGAETMVMVNLTAQGNSTHAGHIHQGTCDAPGEIVVPLQDVTLSNGTGSSSSTIQVPLATVMNGEHIVAYHESAGENPGAPVVCGSIPAQQAGAAM